MEAVQKPKVKVQGHQVTVEGHKTVPYSRCLGVEVESICCIIIVMHFHKIKKKKNEIIKGHQ